MIIGLSGYAQSGKDTVAELLCLNYGYTRMSFAQPMRDAIYTLNPIVFNLNSRVADLVDEYGWDVAKANPEVRRLLQVFGTDVGRKQFGDNFWVQQAFDKLESTKIVFSDVRFPNEANEIIQYGGQVWRVNRHNHAPVNTHKSEHAMDNFMFKHVLYNDGTLDDLSDEVFMLAKELGL
jgi:dephospho-CoA kinase